MFQSGLHYSRDLEMAILGAILLEKTAFGRLYGIMEKDVFYYAGHQEIFRVMTVMWEENIPIDIITVSVQLRRSGAMSIEGSDIEYYVTRTTNAVVSTANLECHGLILRQMYIEREMLKITMSGVTAGDAMNHINTLQDRLLKLTQIRANDDFKGMDELLVELTQHMEKVKDKETVGVTTGFPHLDRMTGGLQPGGMYIVGARPSVGKSAFMNTMVIGAAEKGNKVAVISLEMDNRAITARLSSLLTEVDYWRINRNRMADMAQTEAFYSQIATMSNLPIRISDSAEVDISDIKAKVARLKQRGQIDVLFIDYLQLIDTDEQKGQNREREVSKISRGVKLLAKQFGIPVVILCQLNRLSESGPDKKPKLHNLRESGSLEQDADGVLFIHRDYMSGKKTDEQGNSTEYEADIIVAKWRDGEVTEYKIGFDGPKMKFYELPEATGFRPMRDFTEPNKKPF